MFEINVNGVTSGDRIADFDAGQAFLFTSKKNEANSGLCVRLKDSKAGKNRFANIATGRVLTADSTDTGTPVTAYVDVD